MTTPTPAGRGTPETPQQRLAERHRPYDGPEVRYRFDTPEPVLVVCFSCGQPWPCDTNRVLEAREEAAGQVAQLRETAKAVMRAPLYEQPHVPRSEGGTGFVSVEFITALRQLAEMLDALPDAPVRRETADLLSSLETLRRNATEAPGSEGYLLVFSADLDAVEKAAGL